MSGAALPEASPAERRPLGATIWFVWMAAMWVAFFVLLATDRLDAVWTWVRDQSLVLEGILWVAFFPWLLGTAVWESSWPTALRVILVVCFAIGWTLVSIPRKKRERIQVPA